MRKVGCGKARLLGKPLGREIIGVATGGRLTDLDVTLAHAALHVAVSKSERDAEITRNAALSNRRVLLYHPKYSENDLVVGNGTRPMT